MRILLVATLLIPLWTPVTGGLATKNSTDDPEKAISPETIRKHLKTLSSDYYEGRGPGTAGAKKAREYLIKALESFGAKPGYHGEWTQPVPLRRIQNGRPEVGVKGKEVDWKLSYGEEFVGENRRGAGKHIVDGDLLFVGHGCQAPEYDWDDYKGVDVKGKVLVMLVGDPPTKDASLFGGSAMTYYGRWTYKFDKARDMGAVGCIVIHRAKWAGYGWPVVVNSWNGRHMDVRGKQADRETGFEGWVSWKAAERLVSKTGMTLEEHCAAASMKTFEPVPLGLRFSSMIDTETENFDDENVIGVMRGKDPLLNNEWIIFTAHYDHLGMVDAAKGKDGIYNGAVDNASGCAGLLAIAEAFGRLDGNHRRSIMFNFVCSEEQGLLGSRYYAQNPVVPANKTLANINIDSMNVHDVTQDLQIIGSGQSDLDQTLAEALKPDGRHTAPDSESEKGFYYRSDHFNFARVGIPALYTKAGEIVAGKPAEYMKDLKGVWLREHYHRVSDEYQASWPLTGTAADARALFRVGRTIADRDAWPKWGETSEFRALREQSLGGR